MGVREKEGRTRATPRAWHELTEGLLRRLEREAQSSPNREVYRELVRKPGCRLGLTAALGGSGKLGFTIEVLVDRSLGVIPIETAVSQRGYTAVRLDSGWIAHERKLPRAKLATEWRFLRRIIERRERGASAAGTMEVFA